MMLAATFQWLEATCSRIDHWFLRDAPPHVLAVFRIAFGLWLLLYWGLKAPHVEMLFSTAGLVSALPAFEQLVLSPSSATLLFSVFLSSLLLLTLGYFARTAALIAFLCSAYYWGVSLHLFGTSFDRLYIFILLVLAASPSDATLSLRMLLRRGSLLAWEPVSILPQRILALQITATYFGVGLQKFVLPDWQGGEVLILGFIGRWGSPMAYQIALLDVPILFYDIAVFSVKAFEAALPFGLWSRRFQWWFFAGTALFHTSITLLLSIWWFLILIPANLVFVEPEAFLRFFESRKPKCQPNVNCF